MLITEPKVIPHWHTAFGLTKKASKCPLITLLTLLDNGSYTVNLGMAAITHFPRSGIAVDQADSLTYRTLIQISG
jgi:hypothetical protein